ERTHAEKELHVVVDHDTDARLAAFQLQFAKLHNCFFSYRASFANAATISFISSTRPARTWLRASSASEARFRVNGTAAPGGGGCGTSHRAIASTSSAKPAPVKAEMRKTGWSISQTGERSVLLTTSLRF